MSSGTATCSVMVYSASKSIRCNKQSCMQDDQYAIHYTDTVCGGIQYMLCAVACSVLCILRQYTEMMLLWRCLFTGECCDVHHRGDPRVAVNTRRRLQKVRCQQRTMPTKALCLQVPFVLVCSWNSSYVPLLCSSFMFPPELPFVPHFHDRLLDFNGQSKSYPPFILQLLNFDVFNDLFVHNQQLHK